MRRPASRGCKTSRHRLKTPEKRRTSQHKALQFAWLSQYIHSGESQTFKNTPYSGENVYISPPRASYVCPKKSSIYWKNSVFRGSNLLLMRMSNQCNCTSRSGFLPYWFCRVDFPLNHFGFANRVYAIVIRRNKRSLFLSCWWCLLPAIYQLASTCLRVNQ